MMRRPAFDLVPWMLCLLLVVGTGTVVAMGQEGSESSGSDSKKQESKSKADKTSTGNDAVVYTNEELDRMFSEPEAPPAGALELPAEEEKPAVRAAKPANPDEKSAGAKTTDPLKWMQDRQAREAEWTRLVAEAEQEVGDAERKVEDLEYRLRATRIPFLARPEIPEDEQDQWAGLSASERAVLAQQQLDTAREELNAAKQKLNGLRSQRP